MRMRRSVQLLPSGVLTRAWCSTDGEVSRGPSENRVGHESTLSLALASWLQRLVGVANAR
jgi:hypothetical protein